MTLIPDTRSINLFIGIPYREKFLIYDTDGSLFSFGTGTFSGYIGSLRITQNNGMIEYNKQEGEIVIDISEPVMLTRSAGATTYSIIFTDFQGQETVVAGGTATILARSAVVGGGEPWTAPIKIGTALNYTEFEEDGTIHAVGAATMFKDLLQALIGQGLNNPGGRIVLNYAEATVQFANNTTLSDYVVMPIQVNHDWLLGSDLGPHVHWEQTSSDVPNWLIQHRWQKQGQAKTTAWTSAAWDSNAFTYTSGTFNQITGFPDITPPTGYGEVSDIVQVRLIRDVSNASGLFSGTDPIATAVQASSFDLHYEIDSYGSRLHYAK